MSKTASRVEGYWIEQIGLMRELPAAVTANEPESIHDLRAAGRRLKATIRVYRPLLRPQLAEALLAELDWYNSELGRARDAEVIHEHMAELFADRADAKPLLDELAGEQESLRQEAITILGGDRAAALVDLAGVMVAQPWRRSKARKGKGPTREQIMRRVGWAEQRVGQAWQEVDAHPEGRWAGLHLLRRRAKAARYAYESVAAARSGAAATARYYAELADLLGMVQDAVIVERVLAGRPGELTEYALDEQRRRSQAAEKRVADARKSATASTADSGRLATAPAQPPV